MSIASGRLQLVHHQDSESHREKSKGLKGQLSIKQFTKIESNLEKSAKSADFYISAFISEHNLPIHVADHLSKLIDTDSEIAKNIKCGRTKATAVIKHIIGQQNLENLCAILKTSKFSLIVDESTDLGCAKHLALVVRYFYEDGIFS
jgi:hypothetical protein